MMTADITATLAGFDRRTRMNVAVQMPWRAKQLEALPDDCPRIARGSGVSYVAASFGESSTSQSMREFDRLLAFDEDSGLLHVEAGATVAAVQAFSLARGWYLPVAPGHPQASIGGCIAANVHGKNPARDGCFGAITGRLRLFHPRLGWQETAPGEPLWQATVGGFGLTGSILDAELQLRRAPARIGLVARPVANLVEAADMLRRHADADILYGWHDGRPAHFGRGLIRVGTASDELAPSRLPDVLLPARNEPWPLRLWNHASLAIANTWLARRWRCPQSLALGTALLPLNNARGYFAAYGPRGLLECQWLVPHAAFAGFADALAALVRRRRPLLPLISSKLFDGQAHGPAFDGRGISLALHVAATARGLRFADELAELALDHDGRPNPVKQSGLAASALARAVPELDEWRRQVARHNPGGLMQSELIRRLELA